MKTRQDISCTIQENKQIKYELIFSRGRGEKATESLNHASFFKSVTNWFSKSSGVFKRQRVASSSQHYFGLISEERAFGSDHKTIKSRFAFFFFLLVSDEE